MYFFIISFGSDNILEGLNESRTVQKRVQKNLEDSKNPGESWKLSKQEMKIFMPLPGQRSKTYFKKCFSFVPRGFKIDFQDRKRNDPGN